MTKKKSLAKLAVIALAVLLCLALVLGATGAWYKAQRRATGTIELNQGIIIDYAGFSENATQQVWEKGVDVLLFDSTTDQYLPGEVIDIAEASVGANAGSIDFYARYKLTYKFYSDAEGNSPVELANPADLITVTGLNGSDWTLSGDGYYYYAEDGALKAFKPADGLKALFGTDAAFHIEGSLFVGIEDGEGGAFVVDETTSIERIEVYLTLEALQATDNAVADEAWEITPVEGGEEANTVVGEFEAAYGENRLDGDGTLWDVNDQNNHSDWTMWGGSSFNIQEDGTAQFSLGENHISGTWQRPEGADYIVVSGDLANMVYTTEGEGYFHIYDKETEGHENYFTTEGNLVIRFDVRLWLTFIKQPSSEGGDEEEEYVPLYTVVENLSDFSYTQDDDAKTLTLTKYNGTLTEYTIKSTYPVETAGASGLASTYATEEYTVVAIGGGFDEDVVKVQLPESLTTIQAGAFGMSTLTEIFIPKNVNSIGEQAFLLCTALEKIEVSGQNTTYRSAGNCLIKGEVIIAGCKNSEIPADPAVTEIGEQAFLMCGITSIIIPNTIEIIGDSAFASSEVTSITIPNSVTEIGNGAFGGCKSLLNVTFEEGTKDLTIACYAFKDCGLTSISLPGRLKTLSKEGTFTNGRDPSVLTEITFNATTMPTITESSAAMSPFPETLQTIYVPKDYLEAYTTFINAYCGEFTGEIKEIGA